MREEAFRFADSLHSALGHTHAGGVPYIQHCYDVEAELARYGFTGPVWSARAATHDCIEDTMLHLTPEQRWGVLTEKFGHDVSDPVWCVSGFGPNRKTRNADMKGKIIADLTGRSPILKCADRKGNVSRAERGGRHWLMYRGEMPEFETYIRPRVPSEMWNDLVALFD